MDATHPLAQCPRPGSTLKLRPGLALHASLACKKATGEPQSRGAFQAAYACVHERALAACFERFASRVQLLLHAAHAAFPCRCISARQDRWGRHAAAALRAQRCVRSSAACSAQGRPRRGACPCTLHAQNQSWHSPKKATLVATRSRDAAACEQRRAENAECISPTRDGDSCDATHACLRCERELALPFHRLLAATACTGCDSRRPNHEAILGPRLSRRMMLRPARHVRCQAAPMTRSLTFSAQMPGAPYLSRS